MRVKVKQSYLLTFQQTTTLYRGVDFFSELYFTPPPDNLGFNC